MRDAAFVKACSIIERLRKESQHWRKLVYQVSDEQSAANKALTDIAKHCGMKSWTIPQLVESVGLALAERDSLAGTYSLMQRDHEDGLRREIERIRSEVESLRAKLTIHSDEMTALAAERDAHAAEVESLRAKLNAKTIEWPEWAKVGARVRVRSTRNAVTQRNFAEGEEFVIEKVYYTDWAVRSPRQYWAHLSDLEPVAEHTQPAVAVQS